MHRFREPVNGFTHLAGAVLSLAGLLWLIVLTRDDPVEMLTVAVYGLSMVLLYLASAALHLSNGSPRKLFWLRRVDHAAIYLIIAGTYTPLCYHLLSGGWRWGMLAVVWTLAVIGIVYKLFFLHGRSYRSTIIYMLLGWGSILALPQMAGLLSPLALWLMFGGGAVFTLGAIIFAVEKPNLHRHLGFHELWHLLVMGGCGLHFAAITLLVIG
jgi:hemolysin III